MCYFTDKLGKILKYKNAYLIILKLNISIQTLQITEQKSYK